MAIEKINILGAVLAQFWGWIGSAKGDFFSESAILFSNLQKKIFEKTILNLKLELPAYNSKKRTQISSSG